MNTPESRLIEAISVLFSTGKGSEKGFIFRKERKTGGLVFPEYNMLYLFYLMRGRHWQARPAGRGAGSLATRVLIFKQLMCTYSYGNTSY